MKRLFEEEQTERLQSPRHGRRNFQRPRFSGAVAHVPIKHHVDVAAGVLPNKRELVGFEICRLRCLGRVVPAALG